MAVSLEEMPPITVTAWTKDYVRRGPVVGFNSCEVLFVDNGPGEAVFELDADHERVPDLVAPGARAVVYYAPANAYLSGTVEERTGEGAAEVATRTFVVRDDWSEIFYDITGWPNPTLPDTGQGSDDTSYYKSSGPSETVLKSVVGVNASRMGVPLTVPPSLGRGANISVQIRMHPLADRLFPVFDQAGLGVRVVQKGSAARTLEVYEPVTRGTVLTEASEIIVQGSYQITPPKVTRVVVGAGGEGTARVFRQYVDAAAETKWGVRRELFVDARDIESDPVENPNRAAEMYARAMEALTEGAEKSGLQVELAETENFRFGSAFNVGDRVSIQLNGAPVLTDRVRSVLVSWTPGEGAVVTPYVGEWQDSTDDKINKIVAAATKGVRNLRSTL